MAQYLACLIAGVLCVFVPWWLIFFAAAAEAAYNQLKQRFIGKGGGTSSTEGDTSANG